MRPPARYDSAPVMSLLQRLFTRGIAAPIGGVTLVAVLAGCGSLVPVSGSVAPPTSRANRPQR